MKYLSYIYSSIQLKKMFFSYVALSCLVSQSIFAAGVWTDDLEVASKRALADKKDLLILFTGPTWCEPCQTLETEVFSKSEFETEATKDFILVKFEIPDPEGTEAPSEIVKNAIQSYGIREFPTVLLSNSGGLPYAKAVDLIRGVDAKTYLGHLKLLKSSSVSARQSYADAQKETDAAKKADLLQKALPFFLKNEVNAGFFFDDIKAIAVGDTAGKYTLGKNKYRTLYLNFITRIVENAVKTKKWASAHATIDGLLKEVSYPDSEKQEIVFMKGKVYEIAKDIENAIKTYEEAEKLAPSSDIGKFLKQHIEDLKNRDSDVLDPK